MACHANGAVCDVGSVKGWPRFVFCVHCSPQRMSCRRAVRVTGSCRSTSCVCSDLCRSWTFPTGTRTPVLRAVRRASCSSGAATVAATAGLVCPPRQRLSPAWAQLSPRRPEARQVSKACKMGVVCVCVCVSSAGRILVKFCTCDFYENLFTCFRFGQDRTHLTWRPMRILVSDRCWFNNWDVLCAVRVEAENRVLRRSSRSKKYERLNAETTYVYAWPSISDEGVCWISMKSEIGVISIRREFSWKSAPWKAIVYVGA